MSPGASRFGAIVPGCRRIAGAATAVLGVAVLAGWAFDVTALVRLAPGWPAMSPLTALAVTVGGITLMVFDPGARRGSAGSVVALAGAGLVAAIGLARLAGYASHGSAGWDMLGFGIGPASANAPKPMSEMTALALLLVGLAMLLGAMRRFVVTFQVLGVGAGLIGCLGLSRFMFGGEPLMPFVPMAMPTAVCLIVLAAGTIAMRTDVGLVHLLVVDSLGGLLLRSLLVPSLVLPPAIGWIRMRGQQAGLYGTEQGSALFALSNLVLFGGIVWGTAGVLDRMDHRRRRAEEGRERFLAIVEGSTDAILSKDLEGRITSWNPGAERMFGYEAAEAIGKPVTMLFPSENLGDESEILARVVRGERLEPFHTSRVRRDGVALPVSVSISPIRDLRGRVVGASTIVRDLTSEQHARERARDSEERFRELAENIHEVFWMTDVAKHTMLYVSPAYEEIWGRRCEALYESPRSWAEAIHPDDRPAVIAAARSRQVLGTYDEEYRIVRPDGAIRWIHDRAVPVREANGEVVRVVGVAEDVTERRSLEMQYRQSQKMEAIGQLAGGVAHDFNNLLTVIQGHATLMKMRQQDRAAMLESIAEITVASNRAANLTRQLLAFSRRQTLLARNLDLNELVANLMKMLQRILGEQVAMELSLSPRALSLHADAGMLEQILLNLAVNARDAMPNGGRLVIETSEAAFDEQAAQSMPDVRPGNYACLSVSDTGSGIAREVLPRIFEPFFTTKEIGKGTGLGLATVFGIVKQHGGWINVYSELGHGTTFRVYLPRTADAAGAVTPAPAAAEVRGGRETLLVAEDDPALRALMRAVLDELGYEVLDVPSGVAALETWKQRRGDIRLLLTDLVMPEGMSGMALAERLLAEEPRLRVIYTSGYSAEVAGRNLELEEGVNYIAKPFNLHQLARMVRDELDAGWPGAGRRDLPPDDNDASDRAA